MTKSEELESTVKKPDQTSVNVTNMSHPFQQPSSLNGTESDDMDEKNQHQQVRDEDDQEEEEEEVTRVRVQALDEIVSVNSFFTGAVFIGLSQNNNSSLVAHSSNDPCYATPRILRQLFLLEILSFACFLTSSLFAQGLKVHLILCHFCHYHSFFGGGRTTETDRGNRSPRTFGLTAGTRKNGKGGTSLKDPRFNRGSPQRRDHPRLLRMGILAISAASLCGTAFLVLSIVMIVQLRLGLLTCYSSWAKFATVPLVLLVSCGAFVFSTSVFVAFRD
ncbi:hypothetical protein KP509_06G070500 [Ceratopteris richardii]|uniref:Uncharacterized protein n=1 Tax=Ceratopteris richardii TaxID=49495 RepID=A0A8T2UTZ5_CERRI|nr:hypothetical protein KP509_06G070500 [Ceratopteris richardii]